MTRKNTTALLKQLRSLMKNTNYVSEPLQAYIIPSADAHQNEYVSDHDSRRAFISGFTGSMGTAIVTDNMAVMWTDGRYTLQAMQEMDDNWKLMTQGLPTTPNEATWLMQNLSNESVVGTDPYLYDNDQWNSLCKELKTAGHRLIPVTRNLIDIIWGSEQPEPVRNLIFPLELQFTGMSIKDKLSKVRTAMKGLNATCLIITALDEIAYLYNLRGTDINYNPMFFSYATITPDEAVLFVHESRLTKEAIAQLKQDDINIDVQPYENVSKYIINQVSQDSGKIWLSSMSSYAVANLIPEDRRVSKLTPLSVMKAIKNPVEIKGLENCHIRDASALCRYIHWLEKEVPNNKLNETTAADQLQKYREEQDHYVSLSFPTISSVGPNAAIIHYHPDPKTARVLTSDEIYLFDSGAQYKDGTTDVTRTVHFGTPSDFEKNCFTRVLKGVINLATAVFPEGIQGNRLDSLARQHLWEVGLDYKHGTGHGIGMYLCVHEGPMGISWREIPNDPGLQEGMFLSDEPGYYENGQFGIRIENIIRIVKADTVYKNMNSTYLTFKNVTLVPIQTKMINQTLLTEKEINWLNDYHFECRTKVGRLLLEQGHRDVYEWLVKATQPLG